MCNMDTEGAEERVKQEKQLTGRCVYVGWTYFFSHSPVSCLVVFFFTILTLVPPGHVRNNHFAHPLNVKLVHNPVLMSTYRDLHLPLD